MYTKKPYSYAKLKISLIAIIFALGSTLFGQETFYDYYNWSEKAQYSPVESSEKVVLINKEITEFNYENGNLVEYYLKHTKEFLASDKDIEEGNKRYLVYNMNSDLLFAKARVIKPDGSVIKLDESKILEAVNEQTNEKSKYFAFEGIEKKCIIEYLYAIKKEPSYNGRKKYIQGYDSIARYNYELIAPSSLAFKFKTYNDTAQFQHDTTTDGKNIWTLSLTEIPGLNDELYAPLNHIFKSFVYKLDRIVGTTNLDISSYNHAAQNIYNNMHANITKADKKQVSKFLKSCTFSDAPDLDEKLSLLDNFIKTNIRISNSYSPRGLSNIVTKKIADEFGMVRLYSNILEQNNIEYELALTCNRNYNLFDEEFEAYNCITDYLFYFPGTKKYLDPDNYAYRYGLVPAQFTDHKGLFIIEKSIAGNTLAINKIKHIEPSTYEQTYSILNMEVNINNDISEVYIDAVDSSFGHYSVGSQPYVHLMGEEDVNSFIEAGLKNQMETIDIEEFELKNTEPENIGRLPYIVHSKAYNNDLIERAGNKYLFKIGELIGPQMELYSEDEREHPLYSNYKRMYKRHIELTIPENVKIKNADDLNIYTPVTKDGKEISLFHSHYTLNGNKLTVDIMEYYDQIYYPVEEYENFRSVINSASDFNKVVLVIEQVP